MRVEEVIMAAGAKRNGTYRRVGFVSEAKVKAEHRNAGVKIIKHTEQNARIGCNYEHLNRIIEKRMAGQMPTEKENNSHWIVPNIVSHNDKTGKDYLRLTFADYSCTHTVYEIHKADGTIVKTSNVEDIREYCIPSYLSGNGYKPEVKNIPVENVVFIA